MKIFQGNSKEFTVTSARGKNPLIYSLMDRVIPEASGSKYLGIILHSGLSWTDQVNYRRENPGRQFV